MTTADLPVELSPSEIFTTSQLETHAARIAATHAVSGDPSRARPLLPTLEDSAARLDAAYLFLSAAARPDDQPVGAEEWLRDNHHIVQDQVRDVRQHLPRKYYLELPKLADGPFTGYPRVYLLARELIAHTAGRIDLETIADFTTAYQRITPLTIGETWAVPIMLRLGLVEELDRLAKGVVSARRSRAVARQWHPRLSSTERWDERSVSPVLDSGRDKDGRLAPAFVVELLHWLRDQTTIAARFSQALHRALEAQDDSAEEMLRLEHQREAADQLAIGNAITSMRLLSSIDWTVFFERTSVVERILREDPAGAYPQMDFPTRDRYRHAVEGLAKRAGMSELEVARIVLDQAVEAQQHDPAHDRRHHVGYYLISRGRLALEKAINYPPTWTERFARFFFAHPALGYLGTIAVATAVGIASLLLYADRQGADAGALFWITLLLVIPISELSISVLHLLLTNQIPPRPLPKLRLNNIPADLRTMIVVPTMITSVRRVEDLVADLEVRFLGNRQDNLHFALLTDFADADAQSLPGDDALLSLARDGVEQLNARYGSGRFFLFHRERRWSVAEGRWMGWERKRGKLVEFNRVLRGGGDTSFIVTDGDLSVLPTVRYVITLDSDTQLPMDAAARLIGTLAHPLNKPRFDSAVGRVTEGYGVLQPAVGVDLVNANRTRFAQVFSGHVGIDPYTTAFSDVYQDLFHEGSYVGKGIYDVEAFEAALAGRVPENRLLSHDLFEGSYARTALCTDIQLVDDYPPQYLAFASRQHRWVRGDWQIARWVWRTVPDASGHKVRNVLPVTARWKIFDNLRRSVLAPSLVILLAAGWTVLPGGPLPWTLVALMVLAFPVLAQLARSMSSRVRGVSLLMHIAGERPAIVLTAQQTFLWVALQLHQAVLMLDAIGRTLWRLLVTRRRLLEWVAADRLARMRSTRATVLRSMWHTPLLAVAMLAIVAVVAPERLPIALPFIVLWFCSPAFVLATGQPIPDSRQPIDDAQRSALRMVARRTWLFFEELFAPVDHWLIPDNYQEDRAELIAHRTSPTNIGLQLISTLAAYDFGYLSAPGVIARLEPAFGTLLKLQRYRGHFYNWYDTRTLAPLVPEYVSSVDSGNLAGYLLTTRMGLLQLAGEPRIHGRALDGMRDALRLCNECLARAVQTSASSPARALARELAALDEALSQRPATDDGWQTLLTSIDDHLSSIGIAFREVEDSLVASDSDEETAVARAATWLEKVAAALADHRASLQMDAAEFADLAERAERLAGLADDLVEEMDFGFLYDRERRLFSIGYNVIDGRLDQSFYDTLASEARLTSFVAIATGQIAPEHWFKLGRSLTPTGAERALLSWSASMFEYFMPLLVMRAYPGTLLDETYRAVIARQMHYASTRKVPWGISESAYYAHDLDKNYQYRAFGVPGLGLKRGLADDLVIAPYASVLAAPVVAADVLRNLERLRQLGMAGPYGFYEAIDFTPARVPEKSGRGIVLRTYMAHHQGMSLVALDNALHDYPMQRRFHDDPRVQSADLLLQERIPHQVPLKNPPIELVDRVPSARDASAAPARVYPTPHTLSPRCHTISNGSYVVMVTNAGGGYSRRQQTALTRWREDITTDAWGSFCYVRDLDSNLVWSTAYLPTGREPDEYECTFAPERAMFRRVDGEIETRTEIVVSPEDDAEMRRVSVTNIGTLPRRLDLTSYAEVVLAPADADLSHPAFSNLFVETRSVPGRDALIAVRRPRSGSDRQYLVHLLSGRGPGAPDAQFETDRAKFIGRGGRPDRPLAMAGRSLSNTTGPVLDPIVSLRRSVRLAPGATARLTFTTGYAESEESALALIDKYADRRAIARAIALAAAHVPIELRHLGLTIEDTFAFQRLGGRLLVGDPRLRDLEAVERNHCSQRDLWKFGISGDLPILLVRVADDTGVPLVADLLKAHEYLRRKGLVFDLVILNEHAVTYLQSLQETVERMIDSSPERAVKDRPGGVFPRRADLMSTDDQILLRASARVVMDAAEGRLRNQLARPHVPFVAEPTRTEVSDPQRAVATARPTATPASDRDLEFFNGSGGFAEDGREYIVRTGTSMPPVPWSNVVAHENFGFACTESSAGYTWSVNSHDNRLTPWRNDPVRDPPGEAVFIRNEQTGAFWSATPLPAGGGHPYQTRHGQGYSVYEHTRGAVASELTLFVPRDAPAKVFRLALKNTGASPCRLSVTLYVDWVLGENRSRTAIHVVTATDPDTGALVATNRFRQEFANRAAILDLWCESARARSFTGDRTEFVGRNGSLARPAALGRDQLSNRIGAGHDPCGAIRVQLDLGPSEDVVVLGLIGDVDDISRVRPLVERFRDPAAVDAALADVRGFWDDLLGTLAIRTPDRGMDLIVNRWLLYQTLACRIWGRSAFYQSSGAFGFRDQLQDTLAALAASPTIVRNHLLRAAARQFVEGDVQHWWHEPGGQGVRTRFSDDRLWLPYATLHYVTATGDAAVLEEQVPFLTGRVLNPDEHEAYELPSVARESASLYEHCLRAIEISLATGSHGLPLMGTGDWNDGMSLVGAGGKGESVWLGWFLVAILRPFADLVESRGDAARAGRYRDSAAALARAIEEAWDGDWYRRAYFDDGTPLGSKENAECQIDAIAQSWAVISGAGDPARARQAMASVNERLVRDEDGLVLLLTPPFDKMEPSPGYIRGYLPGVRENGGQYTHAALWNVLAFARLGDGARAFELFSLLNPVNHGRTPEEVARYRAEPYVVAADVYSAPPHTGRGGWTWYTGSAGWMYRVAVEAILGISLRGGALHIDPCIPATWPGYEVVFAPPGAHYRIQVDNPDGVCRGVVRIELDGIPMTGDIPVLRDGASHDVRVTLGEAPR